MDPSEVNVPPLKDLTIDNITENVKLINSQCPDPRLKYLLERLVQHVHDFARETRLSQDEWMKAILFLTSVGQICTDVRQVCIDASHECFLDHTKIVDVGIHPLIRHNRPIPPRRQHRPPQARTQYRRHRPRTIPYPRRDLRTKRHPNSPRSRWRTLSRCLHGQRYRGQASGRRQD